jgi:hypothetical protein
MPKTALDEHKVYQRGRQPRLPEVLPRHPVKIQGYQQRLKPSRAGEYQ